MSRDAANGKTTKVWIGLLLIPIVICLLWRFYDLDRDPPVVSWSIGELLDPGTYLYNARSYALFGDWRPSEGVIQASAGYTYLAALWFGITGIGYAQAVILSVLSGMVLIGATTVGAELAARQWFPGLPRWRAATFALLSMSVSSILFALQRVPKGDMESIAVAAVAALALLLLESPLVSARQGWWLAALGGFGIGMAPFVKLHAAVFSMAALASWCLGFWVDDARWRAIWKRTTPGLVVGIAGAVVVWLANAWWLSQFHLGGEQAVTVSGISHWFVSSGPTQPGAGFLPWRFLRSNLLYRQPVEALLVSVAFAVYVFRVRRSWGLLFCMMWMLSGVALLSVLAYDPLRYRILFTMPAVILGAHLLTSLSSQGYDWVATKRDQWGIACALLFLACGAVSVVELRMNRLFEILPFAAVVMVAALLMAAGLWLMAKVVTGRVFAGLLVAGMIAVALPQWVASERNPTHGFRELAASLPADVRVLGGDVGIEIALWTKLDCREEVMGNVTHVISRETPDVPATVRLEEMGAVALPGFPLPVRMFKVLR